MLVAIMFLLAVLVITMAIAAPKIKEDIQRDRDVETLHRGKQYIRAVQLYYRKFHAYPPNTDALVKTNEIRFLRKKYIDPTTGKDEWRPIPFGQNKAPTYMGFFGQAMGVTSVAGTGPSGGNGVAGASSIGGSPFGQNGSSSSFGSNSFGSSSSGSSSFGSNPGSTSAFGSNPGSSSGTGTGFGATGSGSSDPNGGAGAGGPGNGLTGQTFGGAGIIGFAPGSPKTSILVYKTKTHYNEWEFVYDPASEQMMMGGGGGGLGGQPASGISNPVGGNGLGTNGTGLNPPGGGTSQTPIITPQPPVTTPQPQQ